MNNQLSKNIYTLNDFYKALMKDQDALGTIIHSLEERPVQEIVQLQGNNLSLSEFIYTLLIDSVAINFIAIDISKDNTVDQWREARLPEPNITVIGQTTYTYIYGFNDTRINEGGDYRNVQYNCISYLYRLACVKNISLIFSDKLGNQYFSSKFNNPFYKENQVIINDVPAYSIEELSSFISYNKVLEIEKDALNDGRIFY